LTTSGIGGRIGDLTKYTNKALVRIGKKPTISYIIEAYPKEVPIVVTLGYFGDQVRDFLGLAYPDRKFEFVTVDKYEGPGTSLGYSMLQAKDRLNCPFIFHAADTITEDVIQAPDHNWIAGFKEGDSTKYASWKLINDDTLVFSEKGATEYDYLHMGLIGIFEYEKFWQELGKLYTANPNNSTLNDCQTVEKMLASGSRFEMENYATWRDIGSAAALHSARQTAKDHFDNLDKIDESIFLFDDFVIKFFYDKEVIRKRVERAGILSGLVPEIEGARDNFYRYKFVKGDLYSRVVNPSDFKEFLKWSKENLWTKKESVSKEEFKKVCKDFYHAKTLKRIEKFLTENNIKDSEEVINGEQVPAINDLIAKIDFDWLSKAEQYRMHGDFILDNILKTKDSYCLVDWRQDFGGLTEVGDLYYDLAKLNHNLTVNHDIVNANQFTIKKREHIIDCDILRRENLVSCQKVLDGFIAENGLDMKKVKVLTGLIWLNMSPLHHHPFNIFLYYFGKLNLWRALKD
jgi:choline kinase